MSVKNLLPALISEESWQGGTLYKFTLAGTTAWIVEPAEPLAGKKWFWVPEWPTAFPHRNGVKELLELGYYMIHIHVRGMCGNPEAVEIMKKMYDFIRTLGFARKGALIGMSLGGLYSFRYAATYPESVACIYADAPACDLGYRVRINRADAVEISQAYGEGDNIQAMLNHPLSPVNNYQPMIDAGIPLLLLLGLNDDILPVENNGGLLAERWKESGGKIEVISRPSWGHHPHGLDNPLGKIVRFILLHTLNKD